MLSQGAGQLGPESRFLVRVSDRFYVYFLVFGCMVVTDRIFFLEVSRKKPFFSWFLRDTKILVSYSTWYLDHHFFRRQASHSPSLFVSHLATFTTYPVVPTVFI